MSNINIRYMPDGVVSANKSALLITLLPISKKESLYLPPVLHTCYMRLLICVNA